MQEVRELTDGIFEENVSGVFLPDGPRLQQCKPALYILKREIDSIFRQIFTLNSNSGQDISITRAIVMMEVLPREARDVNPL